MRTQPEGGEAGPGEGGAQEQIAQHQAHTLVISCDTLAAPLLMPAQLGRRLALVGVVLLAFLAFSATFFYYGRPPLVVQGIMNTCDMMFRDGVSSYTLSAPVWGSGTVSY